MAIMKPILTACLILGATTSIADARELNLRSYEELDKMSDIIVVAKPVATRDTEEKTILPHISPDIPVVGLSSEFEIIANLKGDKSPKELVVHHYRLANPDRPMLNAPWLA
jgi:hypothetical protein